MLGCVDVPALALQLVLRAHPEWRDDPVVVVEDDRPAAAIVWCNRPARRERIRRGMSFSQAKAFCSKLHAEVVPEHALSAAIDALFAILIDFSPHVEPVLSQPGLFWLDASGLTGLFGNLERWAAQVDAKLRDERYVAAVIVGHERASAFALARTRVGPLVMRDAAEEQRAFLSVPLERLGIAPKLRDELALLDVHHVSQLLALESGALRVRYGEEAARLHDFLRGKSYVPLVPRIPVAPFVIELEVEPPDDDSARLLFGLKAALVGASERLRKEQHAITALELELRLERECRGTSCRRERIETAAPSLDVVQISDLLRLRLADVDLPARVDWIRVTIEHTRVHPSQLALEHDKKRDLEAAARAIARLRASFGPNAVTRARLCEAHLPEAAFRYEPARAIALPRVREVAELPLVRRLLPAPLALPALPAHEPESWLDGHGAVTSMLGPHRVNHGWWSARGAAERDYYFVETQTGELLWLFYDRSRRRWWLQGRVQ